MPIYLAFISDFGKCILLGENLVEEGSRDESVSEDASVAMLVAALARLAAAVQRLEAMNQFHQGRLQQAEQLMGSAEQALQQAATDIAGIVGNLPSEQ